MDWFTGGPTVDPLIQQAMEALLAILTPDQRRAFRIARGIPVLGSHGGQYTVTCGNGVSGNIIRHGPFGRTTRLCAHPEPRYVDGPQGDRRRNPAYADHAAQVMALQSDEIEVLRVAAPMPY